MKKLLLTSVFFLAGCTPTFPWPVIDEKLDRLNGQPASAAFCKLGPPTSEGKIADKKTYVWLTSKTLWSPSWHISSDDPTGQNEAQSGGGCGSERLQCKLKIFVDNNGKIIGHAIGENGDESQSAAGACANFATRLDPSYRFLPP